MNHPHEDFCKQIEAIAHLYHWRVARFRAAQNAKGVWRTPVAADGVGFPDFLMVNAGAGEIIAAEIKIPPDKIKPAQQEWLNDFSATAAQVYVWMPDDWDKITKVLSGEVT